jgi:hypothetical protein
VDHLFSSFDSITSSDPCSVEPEVFNWLVAQLRDPQVMLLRWLLIVVASCSRRIAFVND